MFLASSSNVQSSVLWGKAIFEKYWNFGFFFFFLKTLNFDFQNFLVFSTGQPE